MKSNTTYQPPKNPIENLGDGSYYYNFNIVKTVITDEEGETYDNYDYDQVRLAYPIDTEDISAAISTIDNKINLDYAEIRRLQSEDTTNKIFGGENTNLSYSKPDDNNKRIPHPEIKIQ